MSNEKYNTLAFDFGASSGRAIVGSFDGEKIELSEIHRFQRPGVCRRNYVLGRAEAVPRN